MALSKMRLRLERTFAQIQEVWQRQRDAPGLSAAKDSSSSKLSGLRSGRAQATPIGRTIAVWRQDTFSRDHRHQGTSMDNLTRQIADFAAKLSYEKLPQKVVSAATRFLIDSLACGIAAYDCESARMGLCLARGARPDRYPGRILFHRETSTAKSAALVNTAMIRNLDFND